MTIITSHIIDHSIIIDNPDNEFENYIFSKLLPHLLGANKLTVVIYNKGQLLKFMCWHVIAESFSW